MHHDQHPPALPAAATPSSGVSGAAWWHRAALCAGGLTVPAALAFGAGMAGAGDAATLAGGLTMAVTLPATVFAEHVSHQLTAAGGTR